MRKLAKSAVLVMAFAIVLLVAGSAFAAGTNLGFESGNLNGWSGVGSAVSALAPNFPAPASGKFMLQNNGPSCATNSVTQTVSLKKDRAVSGLAALQADDYLPYDDEVSVTVNGTPVYTKAIHDVGSFGHSAFEKWVFVAPADGDYTVSYNSTNAIDCAIAPTILGDAVTTTLTCAALVPTLGMSCSLTDDATGAGIAGKTVQFSGGSATTDAAGVATISVLDDPVAVASAVVAGGYSAEFYGDIDANGSSGSAGLA